MKYLCHLTQASGPCAPAPQATAAMCCVDDQMVNEAIAIICTILGDCALSPPENMCLSFSICKLW